MKNNQEIKVYIEIPQGSRIKYEYNRKTKVIEVDRILRQNFQYPANYGFIREALDWDGDELDVLVYSQEKFLPGVLLNARIIGAMKMIDNGETDTKIIAVHANDYRLSAIESIEQLPVQWITDIKNFFLNYKNWKGKEIIVISGFEDQKFAINEYNECVNLMKNYGHLSKKEFIEKMKLARPEKYQIVK